MPPPRPLRTLSCLRMGRLNLKLFLWISLAGALGSLVSFLFCCGNLEGTANRIGPAALLRPSDPARPHGRRKMGLQSLVYGGGSVGGGDVAEEALAAEDVGGGDHCDTIPCVINKEYSVSCRREADDVYLPFSFIGQYFEVYGRLVEEPSENGCPRFEWSHSYSSTYLPKEKYNPKGCFLWFNHYNVEAREKVKYISGVEGVPVSNQWYADGHFYPIQIAQFALQHYCKNRTDGPPKVTLVADFDQKQGEWRIPNDKAFVQRVYDSNRSSYIVTFDITHTQGLELEVPQGTSGVFVLTMDVMPKSKNFSFSVSLLEEKTGETYDLHYVNEGELFLFSSSKATYGVHLPLNSWTQFVRDLHVDVLKGKSAANGKKWKMNKARLRVTKIVFRGKGSLNLVTLASSQHSAFFFYGADWFMRHQDENGAWGCTVERRLAGGSVLLPPGWYSAMGQGHAISVLTRAYHVSGDVKYLEAAQRALEPFRRDSSGSGVSSDSSRRGVRAWFLGHLPWYEEYPSDPPSFVLNGFIYSLFGLYDLKDKSSDAKQLFETGLESLLKLLPLFDTGSGSVYDLRHVSLGIAPNLARWDYHTVHINQLTHLATIIDAPLLNETAKRWASYLKGKRASHN